MKKNEKKIAIAIYEGEDVIACLKQELMNAIAKSILAGDADAEEGVSITTFRHPYYSAIYGNFMGLVISVNDTIKPSEDMDRLCKLVKLDAISAQIAKREAEIAELKNLLKNQ
jgi:hypothetical protein